jgi:hypothetical protein
LFQVIGRSQLKLHKPGQSVLIEHLVPAHWSKLGDWIVHFSQNSNEMVFREARDFLDESWRPQELPKEHAESFFTYELPIIPGVINMLHSLMICYILWRLHMITFVFFERGIELVEAKKDDSSCFVPVEIYAILYKIIFLQVFSLAPAIIGKCANLFGDVWNTHVDHAAVKKLEKLEKLRSDAQEAISSA